MSHTLPALNYAYDALEPFIDAKTMEIHHTKHHQTYVDKLNAALENYPDFQNLSAEDLLRKINEVPEAIRTAVINHGGGHANHTFFWSILKRNVDFSGEIAEAVGDKFGSFEELKKEFSQEAALLFGSGWTWLVLQGNDLEIVTTPNQNSPLMDSPLTERQIPILGLDVWEHAYYLKYQNRRPEYIEAFFNVINWERVNEIFLKNK